ncbi:MAG: CaiB/BaiF CoA transferase family protein [Janthinobacterium lividum]
MPESPAASPTPPQAPQQGPLAGIRVVDLTTVMMGPSATQALAEMGADVMKVEAPGGDPIRGVGPARHPGMGGLFINANSGKRSIGIDLKRPEGRDALLRLLGTADVLAYNVRPQAMARLGLSYAAVAAVRPGIVYAGMFGYGQDGPYAARPAYDDLIQGAALIPWLMARSGNGEPRYVPNAIADRVVGLTAVAVICAALLHRERTGEGQQVDVPMFETMVRLALADHMGGLTFEPPLDAGGYPRLLTPERRPYRTRDGYICALLYNDKQWRAFHAAIGQAERWAADPRGASMGSRNEHIGALYAEVSAVFAERTTAEWARLLEAADIPFTPMHDLSSILEDPHLVASGFFVGQHHPSEGRLRRTRPSERWSRSQPPLPGPAPRYGEHSAAILREAGLAEDAIATLLRDGAVTQDVA